MSISVSKLTMRSFYIMTTMLEDASNYSTSVGTNVDPMSKESLKRELSFALKLRPANRRESREKVDPLNIANAKMQKEQLGTALKDQSLRNCGRKRQESTAPF